MRNVGFNEQHPELLSGEVFITNIVLGRILDDEDDWSSIGWKTKRLGHQAYDINGKPIRDFRPVFAQREELKKAGVSI